MTFNFPNAPSNGQVYTPAGSNKSYVYAAGVWRGTMTSGGSGGGGGGGGASITVSDSPPLSPTANQLWFESDTGNTYIWYDDGDSQQWVQVNVLSSSAYGGVPYAVQSADTFNRLVNGAFQISQENALDTDYTTIGTYVADQWAFLASKSVGNTLYHVYTITGNEPYGLKNFARGTLTVATPAPTSGDYQVMLQYVEGLRLADLYWGTAAAKPVVLRFKARTSPAGTFSIAVRNGNATNRTFVKNCTTTAANVWQDFVVVIPGDTTGTWVTDNTRALTLFICMLAGSNVASGVDNSWNASGGVFAAPGITNFCSATGQYVDIANVGLYADPNGTGRPPPFVVLDYASDLAACERYFQTVRSSCSANVTSGQAYVASSFLNCDMRAAPTCTGVNVVAASFPATVGSLGAPAGFTDIIRESRTANATAYGNYETNVTASARL